jgi:hypothetical protein
MADDDVEANEAKSRGISPARRHKVALIKQAAGKSDAAVHSYLNLIDGYGRTLAKFGPDPKYANGVAPLELGYLLKLSTELLHARDRVDRLHTGLRCEREVSGALTELAAAFTQWHRAMSSTDNATVARAQASMKRHFDAADRLGKAATANLKRAV